MKKIYSFLIVGILIIIAVCCKQENYGPNRTSAGGPPSPISNMKVQNLSGAAKISYTLPDNPDLLYVMAKYKTGIKEREVKSSMYNNFLLVEGFGDTIACQVELYAVNRYEEKSTPVSVTVKPLESPVSTIAKSISADADFGGLTYTFYNAVEAEVSIHVLMLDSVGVWRPAQDQGSTPSVQYTKRMSGTQSVRGLPAVERKFAIYIKDRWENHSDTLKYTFTPLPEIELDRKCSDCFKEVKYASDAAFVAGWGVDMMFNDVFAGGPTYHTQTSTVVPQWFTFKVGPAPTYLSRFKMWQRDGNEYTVSNVRKFEIWGSNNPSDNWSSWELLGTFESIRPSGLPATVLTLTSEDAAYVKAGEEFVFPPGTPAVQYLRFKTTETWGLANYVTIGELRFWGKP